MWVGGQTGAQGVQNASFHLKMFLGLDVLFSIQIQLNLPEDPCRKLGVMCSALGGASCCVQTVNLTDVGGVCRVPGPLPVLGKWGSPAGQASLSTDLRGLALRGDVQGHDWLAGGPFPGQPDCWRPAEQPRPTGDAHTFMFLWKNTKTRCAPVLEALLQFTQRRAPCPGPQAAARPLWSVLRILPESCPGRCLVLRQQ